MKVREITAAEPDTERMASVFGDVPITDLVTMVG
jgi:hypothetical protein